MTELVKVIVETRANIEGWLQQQQLCKISYRHTNKRNILFCSFNVTKRMYHTLRETINKIIYY